MALLRISQFVDDARPASRPDSFHFPTAEIKQPSENGPVVNLYFLLSLAVIVIAYEPGLGFIYRRRQQPKAQRTQPCSSISHLPLATGQGDVNESSNVLVALESTALGGLGLLLGLDL